MNKDLERKGLPRVLPAMLGEQYLLTRIVREEADCVIYLAQQKDIRREVYVRSLRPEMLNEDAKVAFFLESARAKSRSSFKFIGLSLELLFQNETWHLVYEKVSGESLDMILSTGGFLPPARLCEFLLNLCHVCLYLDIEGVAGESFQLEHCYYHDHAFRMDNPATAGIRKRTASRTYLHDAVVKLEPLLDHSCVHAEATIGLMQRMRYQENWETISPMYFAEELAQLQLRILWGARGTLKQGGA